MEENDGGFAAEEEEEQVDWDILLKFVPNHDDHCVANLFDFDLDPPPPPPPTSLHSNSPPPPPSLDNTSPDSSASASSAAAWLEDILMSDDHDSDLLNLPSIQHQVCNDFFADILLDSPAHGDASSSKDDSASSLDGASSPAAEQDKTVIETSLPDDHDDRSPEQEEGEEEEEEEEEEQQQQQQQGLGHENNAAAGKGEDQREEDPDGPISKKRRRQLRNRDAAVRSRERKKMYVKDLELKSRYLEAECRRLGRLLQCFVAENQALRLSLYKGNASGVPSTKQESAVLLLESLLLGSLLWFLGIMCLFSLPKLVAVPPEKKGREVTRKEAPRGVGNRMLLPMVARCFGNGRRCKGWRRKMKEGPFTCSAGLGLCCSVFSVQLVRCAAC